MLAIALQLRATGLLAQAPTLGTYPNTSIISGKNATITPSPARANTTSAVAYTNTNFTGLLSVNPGTAPVSVAIGDFNGDGNQNLATAKTNFGGFEGKVRAIENSSNTVDAGGDGHKMGITTGYALADDDTGDAFTVDVAMDSVYITPVFRLKAGQSSCPWEEGTANRDAPNLGLAGGATYTSVNIPAHEPAVFKLNLGNLSATNEDRVYGFTAIAGSNPDGAIIKLNGHPLNSQLIQYLVPFGEAVPLTLTVERGPVEYDYEDLVVAEVSECEFSPDVELADNSSMFFSALKLGVHFIRPCSEVAIYVPEQNWVVQNDDPIQPGTTRRITVSGYDLNSTDFQLVRVQYRRSDGDGAWINLPGTFKRHNPNWSGFVALPDPKPPVLGPSFTQFFWETAGLGDGPYEIHAWAVCTGDASDKPGFSQIIKGRIDREPPSLIGLPQPSDAVYTVRLQTAEGSVVRKVVLQRLP